MNENEPTHQIFYRKTPRTPWKMLERANFLSLNDAEILADQLAKVVLSVEVRNTVTGKTEYIH